MIRIAVCEDDYVYTEIIRSILQSCVTVPYEVKFFSSGTEFLNTLTDHGCPYTLVITDIDLGAHRGQRNCQCFEAFPSHLAEHTK